MAVASLLAPPDADASPKRRVVGVDLVVGVAESGKRGDGKGPRGDSDSGPQVLQARLAITHAMRESVRAIDMLFYIAGTNAIHESNDLELYFRDIHTAGQHIAGLHSNFEYGGQALLGLLPGASGW